MKRNDAPFGLWPIIVFPIVGILWIIGGIFIIYGLVPSENEEGEKTRSLSKNLFLTFGILMFTIPTVAYFAHKFYDRVRKAAGVTTERKGLTGGYRTNIDINRLWE